MQFVTFVCDLLFKERMQHERRRASVLHPPEVAEFLHQRRG
jgi:hypothetical protein